MLFAFRHLLIPACEMKFEITEALSILERTPAVLEALLSDLSDDWVMHNEGPDTWSPFDVVGHLIHGEKTDWIPRMEIILGEGDKRFVPFDRFAMFDDSKGKTMSDLLEEFRTLREANIARLKSVPDITDRLDATGIHPDFGEVTLGELLATWTVHDLNHLYQISRVMAKQFKTEVGPWVKYLRALEE